MTEPSIVTDPAPPEGEVPVPPEVVVPETEPPPPADPPIDSDVPDGPGEFTIQLCEISDPVAEQQYYGNLIEVIRLGLISGPRLAALHEALLEKLGIAEA